MWRYLILSGLLAGCAGTTGPRKPVSLQLLTLDQRAASAAQRATTHPGLTAKPQPLKHALTTLASSRTVATLEQQRAKARAFVGAARDAYRKIEFAKVLENTQAAERLLTRIARTPKDVALLAEVAVLRALTLLAGKDEQGFRTAIVTALALGWKGPQAGALPPEPERRVRALIDARRTVPDGTVSIVSTPPGALATVNGRARGKTPITLHLAEGVHHLRLTRADSEPKAMRFTLSSGKSERVEAFLKPADRVALARRLNQDKLDVKKNASLLAKVLPAKAYLVTVGADGLVEVGQVQGRGLAVQRTGCSHSGSGECLAEWFYQRETGQSWKQPPPWWRRWWFLTLVSAAVVGAGAGIAVAAVPPPSGVDVFIQSRPSALRR